MPRAAGARPRNRPARAASARRDGSPPCPRSGSHHCGARPAHVGSPRHTSVSARRLPVTVTAGSWPGSTSQTSVSCRVITSHQSRCPRGTSGKRKWTTVRPVGDRGLVDVAVHVPQQQLRVEVLVAQLADPADCPRRRAPRRPAAARWPAGSARTARRCRRSAAPRCRRVRAAGGARDSRVGDIRGRPRRSSLKRSAAETSSRITSSVQRSSSSSMALETGQNWWYGDPMASSVGRQYRSGTRSWTRRSVPSLARSDAGEGEPR